MKSILLVRHAKSSWDDLSLPDKERPLNERGKKDAPEIAGRLLNRKVKIDAFVSSPAKRALKTAKIFAEKYTADKKDIHIREDLYPASVAAFYKVIETLDEKWDHVALFSHNPGITEFANSLGVAKIDEMPTCSVFAVHSNAKTWKDFGHASHEFWFFEFPKMKEG